ncbi:MAG: hypothetical protein HZC47_06495 [Methanobacterium sp.]|uniref:hypothetical protein n=1 Tax=Methanobacterium sp. TaxID=2164 RepID=UPI003D6463AF|nr:hypothetical protein [Methanobacterium sp.]
MNKKATTMVILLLILAAIGLYIFYNSGEKTTLGYNSNGYITKEVYNHYGASKQKIAVITGMHPREDLSKSVVPSSVKYYALTHNIEIVNYQVSVTNQPEVFTASRSNGEGLVAQYIVPDIQKSDYSLVIICHDHEKGYGTGYYIATPSMDSKSVSLAGAVHNLLPNFNYYQRATDEKPKSSSIMNVDNPITSTGTPVFVYEIPEWYGSFDAFFKSNSLIDASFKVL